MSTSVVVPALRRAAGTGFANLLRKELSLWFGTRRAIIQALVSVGIINGAIAGFTAASGSMPVGAGDLADMQVNLFMALGGMVTALAAVIATQDAIIGERQLGTAAWVLSKPASRAAFILAKFAGHGLGLWLCSVLLPSALAYLEMLAWGEPPTVARFLMATGLLSLNLLFYLGLSLMLGTFFVSRAPVLGIPLALLLGGSALAGVLPKLILVTPVKLPDIGMMMLLGALPPDLYPFPLLPIILTALYVPLMLVAALWKFQRDDL